MEENTWRLFQCMMWLIGTQTVVLGAIFGYILTRITRIETLIDHTNSKLDALDRRMVAIETVLKMKECCQLSNTKEQKKAI